MWFIGVEVEQETSAPPPKKKILDPPLIYAKRLQQRTLFYVPSHKISCIINPAVQTIPFCEPFITEYLLDENLTETASDL